MRPVALLALASAFGLAASGSADPLPGARPRPEALRSRIEQARMRIDPGAPPRTRHLDSEGRPRFTNRLVLETSPYLRQHAHNPVDWFPWSDEAFAVARALGRPVFLSVGYSTCHWCHVMEEESFEDLEIAETLNRHFVAIKVDREERPDVDGVYMHAVQALSGGVGWPMSVFLTPDGGPFYGGTYFPPRDRPGSERRGFLTVLQTIRRTWDEKQERVRGLAEDVTASLREGLDPAPAVGMPGARELRAALRTYRTLYDPTNGGLRRRQKFPSSLPVPFLLRMHRRTGDAGALEMATHTLDAMLRGGIYDHVGGGFHRYTVEPTWTVPHFEKMLYDQALLVLAYAEAYQVTGAERYARVVRDVLDYLVREMRAPGGAFLSATDADSEGEEGTYFLWTPEQVSAAAGKRLAALARLAFGVSEEGNFEGGRTVLRRDASVAGLARRLERTPDEIDADLESVRSRLREFRSRRVPPHTDRKQIVAWNGLAISAFARAGFVLRRKDLVEHGARAAGALLRSARPNGRLARYLSDGEPHGTGLVDDHAFLIAGLIDLYEATGSPSWLDAALELQEELDRRFFDDAVGGYYVSPVDGDTLIAREKPGQDGALPSGNSIAAVNLLRLWLLTADDGHHMRAEMTVRAFSDLILQEPTAFGRMLDAVDFMLDRPKEILVVTPGEATAAEPFLRELSRVFLPNRVLVVAAEPELPGLVERLPLLEQKRAIGQRTTAYVCENRVCDLPARDVETFRKQIRKAPPPYPVARAGRPTAR